MSNQDGKLIATAMGAAAAGATLAVMAMKMIESKNEKSFYNNNNNIGGGGGGPNNNTSSNNILDSGLGASNTNLLAYHADENRPIRPTVIMNDPSDLVGDHHADSSFNVASAGASQYVDIDANIGVPGVGVGGPALGNMRRDSSEAMLFPHNHEEKMRRRIATRYTIEEENNLGRDSVTVRVPATSANVGPGCKLNKFSKNQNQTNQSLHCEEFQN
jgi:hypothetical protein